MTIAILGAGIQGCCAALELASLGHQIELFDKSSAPMCKASRWNEGKLHLGYVYANDTSYRTAEAMIQGSLAFYQFFCQHLGCEIPEDKMSSSFIYGVHKDSLLSVSAVTMHFHEVDQIIHRQIHRTKSDYLGAFPIPVAKQVTVDDYFNPDLVSAAFQSPERSVNADFIADRLIQAIQQHPLIHFCGSAEVASLSKKNGRSFTIVFQDGRRCNGYQQIVNATWEDRLRIDQTLGYQTNYNWLHRYKLAVHMHGQEYIPTIPSCTLVLGPFGDVVNFEDGSYYLSWYPICCVASSRDLQPQDSNIEQDRQSLSFIAEQTFHELTQLVPELSRLNFSSGDILVKGGHICAPGLEDIDQLSSRLHQRHQSGVWSHQGYHSMDTGKYTFAPHYARILGSRLAG